MGCQNSKIRTEEAARPTPAAAPSSKTTAEVSAPVPAAPAAAAIASAPQTPVEAAVEEARVMAAPEPAAACDVTATPMERFAEAIAAVDADAQEVSVAVMDASVMSPTLAAPEAAAEVVAEPVVEAAPTPMALKPALRDATAANNSRRVGFAAPTKASIAAAAPEPTTRLNRHQKSMIKTGHVSSGRRGPVASKHSRCTAQMQQDKYLDMVNAFERLLTNVHHCDAHLDSR